MAYNPNIPQPPDIKAISQAQMLNNFIEINNLLAINHQTFGAPNEGTHTYLQMSENAAPSTTIDQIGLYAAVGATSTTSELVFKRETPGPGGAYPQTVAFTESVAGASNVSPGWTRLPSGHVMQWGTYTILITDPSVCTFAFPFLSYCYFVDLQPYEIVNVQNFTNVIQDSVTNTGFQAQSFSRNQIRNTSTVIYFAIGI